MAQYLVDTHVALWWWRDVSRLAGRVAQVIATSDQIWISAATSWEISSKWRSGKLDMIGDPAVHYPVLMAANRFQSLPITDVHALAAGLLPGAHRDPFDRMIAAQALAEDMTVITRDPVFSNFGCKVLW